MKSKWFKGLLFFYGLMHLLVFLKIVINQIF